MYRSTEGAPLLVVASAGEENRYATVRALDPSTGEERWAVSLSPGGVPRMCIEGEEIFVLSGADLTCLDYRSGACKWQSSTPSGGERESQVLALLGGMLYAASGGFVSAFDPSSGEMKWKAAVENVRFRALGVPGSVVQGDFARKRADRLRRS